MKSVAFILLNLEPPLDNPGYTPDKRDVSYKEVLVRNLSLAILAYFTRVGLSGR